MKLEESYKGELTLAQLGCTLKWFGIKGTRICEVLPNLPITLLLQLLIKTPPCQGFAHGCRGSTRGYNHLAPQWLTPRPWTVALPRASAASQQHTTGN
ncbi:hypothetical protein CFC21_001645 [Triticum aestivum]|uniref:Uncharacterized protein n=3 Tax=Triticum TaxID=4564 RepID=A0A9R0UVE1_TRITD|nr:hypothetical protein TRIUR3_30285 [Triticum urartu]KAF6983463.1 hypothetical protein CFC21_001645 [Triticum aestivum]VAH04342.1 unnamed protein product [Triticum turgidum subsp. durum]